MNYLYTLNIASVGGSCAPSTSQGDTIYRTGAAGGTGVVVIRNPQ